MSIFNRASLLFVVSLFVIGCEQTDVEHTAQGENEGEAGGEVLISELGVKALIPGQTVTAGYFNIKNGSAVVRTLVAVSSAQAERVEMHQHVHRDGMMGMEKMDSFEVPANGEAVFAPGGNHLMIFSPNEEVLAKGSMDLVFEFQNGETLHLAAPIKEWK